MAGTEVIRLVSSVIHIIGRFCKPNSREMFGSRRAVRKSKRKYGAEIPKQSSEPKNEVSTLACHVHCRCRGNFRWKDLFCIKSYSLCLFAHTFDFSFALYGVKFLRSFALEVSYVFAQNYTCHVWKFRFHLFAWALGSLSASMTASSKHHRLDPSTWRMELVLLRQMRSVPNPFVRGSTSMEEEATTLSNLGDSSLDLPALPKRLYVAGCCSFSTSNGST